MRRVLAAAIVALSAVPALACSCLPPEQAAKLPPADVIVDATVQGIYPDSGGKPEIRVVLQVHQSSTGNLTGRAQVRTAASAAACGVPFRVGQRQRIAMMRAGQVYVTSSCLMQRALTRADR